MKHGVRHVDDVGHNSIPCGIRLMKDARDACLFGFRLDNLCFIGSLAETARVKRGNAALAGRPCRLSGGSWENGKRNSRLPLRHDFCLAIAVLLIFTVGSNALCEVLPTAVRPQVYKAKFI